jgi:hypothetical protein
LIRPDTKARLRRAMRTWAQAHSHRLLQAEAFARANARVRITRLRLVGSRGRRADAVGDGEWDGLGGAGVFAEGNRPL